MYLMMQLADLGAFAEATEENAFEFHINQTIYAFVQNKLQTDEELVKSGFGSECLSEREKVMKFLFCQIAEGLEYMHDTALVANRDLKPCNMLFATQAGGTNVKLYDRA